MSVDDGTRDQDDRSGGGTREQTDDPKSPVVQQPHERSDYPNLRAAGTVLLLYLCNVQHIRRYKVPFPLHSRAYERRWQQKCGLETDTASFDT